MSDRDIRSDFEQWVECEIGLSARRYDKFPYSYCLSEVGAMYDAWVAAYRCYVEDERVER